MTLVRVTPPAIEPLTLAEVVAHLRLDDGNVEPVPGAPSVALALAGAGNVTTALTGIVSRLSLPTVRLMAARSQRRSS
jgi:hypothetical protein